MKLKITKDHDITTTFRDMRVGQLAVICDDDVTPNGIMVIRTHSDVVQLEAPYHTWPARERPVPVRVRILPTGAEVTLTQE